MHCLVLSVTIFCDLGSCHSACSFALDIEWRNLILEENALGDHSRVERIATEKLQMQHVDPSQENIVVQK